MILVNIHSARCPNEEITCCTTYRVPSRVYSTHSNSYANGYTNPLIACGNTHYNVSHCYTKTYTVTLYGQTYRIKLHNSNNLRCDAQVDLDGKTVGTWRINAHDSITLERPANDNGKFTFYKIGTSEAHSAQLSNDASLGLLKVTFTPEVDIKPVKQVSGASWAASDYAGDDYPVMMGAMPYGTSKGIDFNTYTTSSTNYRSAGGTGLSGHSGQYFSSVAPLDYDYSGQTVIHLRLVCKEDDGPRPLTQYSTPVPPRIG